VTRKFTEVKPNGASLAVKLLVKVNVSAHKRSGGMSVNDAACTSTSGKGIR